MTIKNKGKGRIDQCASLALAGSTKRFSSGTPKAKCASRARTKRRINPERNLTQNTLAVVKGWLKRNCFVFLVNSLVKEMAPRNREKRIGRTKWLKIPAYLS